MNKRSIRFLLIALGLMLIVVSALISLPTTGLRSTSGRDTGLSDEAPREIDHEALAAAVQSAIGLPAGSWQRAMATQPPFGNPSDWISLRNPHYEFNVERHTLEDMPAIALSRLNGEAMVGQSYTLSSEEQAIATSRQLYDRFVQAIEAFSYARVPSRDGEALLANALVNDSDEWIVTLRETYSGIWLDCLTTFTYREGQLRELIYRQGTWSEKPLDEQLQASLSEERATAIARDAVVRGLAELPEADVERMKRHPDSSRAYGNGEIVWFIHYYVPLKGESDLNDNWNTTVVVQGGNGEVSFFSSTLLSDY